MLDSRPPFVGCGRKRNPPRNNNSNHRKECVLPTVGVVEVCCQMWLAQDATFSGGKIHKILKRF